MYGTSEREGIAGADQPRAEVLGCAIDRVDIESTVARCEELIASRGYGQHMAINAAKLVAMRNDADLREVIRRSEIVTADGQAVVWAAKLLSDPLPERVAGIDLMHALLARAEASGYRPYILGARQEVLEEAVKRIRERYPRLQLAGYRDGYFAQDEDAQVADQIRRTRPDMLFVAISSPRKEIFLGRYGRRIGAPFVMGVGGSIDVVAGLTRRAPEAIQRIGMEWFFRLLQEPRRLARRYAVTNLQFVALLAREVLRRRLSTDSRRTP